MEIVRRHPTYHSGIQLQSISPSQLIYVSADEDQIKQLLLNLAVNACEAFEGRAGIIQFEVVAPTSPAGEITVKVRDDGPGLSAEQMKRVFLPFYSTKKGGSGLGLAIVSRLMEAVGGRVELHSRIGAGTEFRLFFRGMAIGSLESAGTPRT
jgi:signal transduction histidine kinase